jgi:hypothetical protein
MKPSDGVSFFTVFAANPEKIKLFFPNGKACCANCHFLYNEHGLNRSRCRITDDIIHMPNYPALPESCVFEPTGEIVGHKYKEKVNE